MNTTHIRTSKYYPCYSVVYYYSYVSFAMEKMLVSLRNVEQDSIVTIVKNRFKDLTCIEYASEVFLQSGKEIGNDCRYQ